MKGKKHMANQKRRMKIASGILVFVLALAMIFSASLLLIEDTVEQIASHIKKSDAAINTNRDQFLNSAVMYQLPDTVKDTDDISVIVQMNKTASLLDAYEAGNKSVPFTEYVESADADRVVEGIRAEKEALVSAIDAKSIAYTLGADYKAVMGGFEVVIKAGDFKALCCSSTGTTLSSRVPDSTCSSQRKYPYLFLMRRSYLNKKETKRLSR